MSDPVRYTVETEISGRAVFEMPWDGPEPPTDAEAWAWLMANDVADNLLEWQYESIAGVEPTE